MPRIGKYLKDLECSSVALIWGEHLRDLFGQIIQKSLQDFFPACSVVFETTLSEASVELLFPLLTSLPSSVALIIGIGGGVAIDSAKWIGHVLRVPVMLVPTIISQDAFASGGVSLDVKGVKKSLKATPPVAVVLDPSVIRRAPISTTYAGVGEMAGKISSLVDWKIAFHICEKLNKQQLQVDDLAVTMLYVAWQACIFFPVPTSTSEPRCLDLAFLKTLAHGLLMSGLAMNAAGSSRPASGSEHLISHALDRIHTERKMPHLLHGVQVGLASYITTYVQQHISGETHPAPSSTSISANAFDHTKKFLQDFQFFEFCATQPEPRKLRLSILLEAIQNAPTVKGPDFATVLSVPGALEMASQFAKTDKLLHSAILVDV